MKIKNDFSSILESYFSKHLKLERKFSINTYDTYLTVLKQFINYLSDELKIKRHELSLYDFNKKNIMTFLDYVERSLKCSSKTRNHKLTIINSFLEYAQSINPVYIDLYLSSKSLKM